MGMEFASCWSIATASVKAIGPVATRQRCRSNGLVPMSVCVKLSNAVAALRAAGDGLI